MTKLMLPAKMSLKISRDYIKKASTEVNVLCAFLFVFPYAI